MRGYTKREEQEAYLRLLGIEDMQETGWDMVVLAACDWDVYRQRVPWLPPASRTYLYPTWLFISEHVPPGAVYYVERAGTVQRHVQAQVHAQQRVPRSLKQLAAIGQEYPDCFVDET